MTFNQNLGDSSGRAQGGGNSGGSNFGGGNRGGGNFLINMLVSQVGARFGLPGIIIAGLVIFFLNSGGGIPGIGGGGANNVQGPQTDSNALAHCKTYEDANEHDDCRIQATATVLDDFWQEALPQEANIQYTKPGLFIGSGQLNTACGAADASQSGPFYCPGDETAYFATPFFKQLRQMGGSDGPFAQMYVVAHEFGHHIQHLEGNLGLSDYNNPGEDSNAVKMELQADCYAGVWAHHATTVPGDSGRPLISELTQDDIDAALDTADKIGDDHIQTHLGGGQVDESQFSHGSSVQRERWFTTGLDTGDAGACDTFAARSLG